MDLSKIAMWASLLAVTSDLAFDVPSQGYSLRFSARRGGCLYRLTDTATGHNVLDSEVGLSLLSAAASPENVCTHPANPTVLSRTPSRLIATAETAPSVTRTRAKRRIMVRRAAPAE